MSSGYIPPKNEPGPDGILKALREAVFENPRLTEMPSEEVARHLVLGGHLQEEPSPALVADMLQALDEKSHRVDLRRIDFDKLTDEQLQRIIDGEDPFRVLWDDGSAGFS